MGTRRDHAQNAAGNRCRSAQKGKIMNMRRYAVIQTAFLLPLMVGWLIWPTIPPADYRFNGAWVADTAGSISSSSSVWGSSNGLRFEGATTDASDVTTFGTSNCGWGGIYRSLVAQLRGI